MLVLFCALTDFDLKIYFKCKSYKSSLYRLQFIDM